MLANWQKELFISCLKSLFLNNFFIFDGKCYEQCDGVAVGSPIRPILANVFMCHFENLLFENFPPYFKAIVYRRFVDDTFLLFQVNDYVE